MATLIGGNQMAGKSNFMKREAELEMEITEKIAERKPQDAALPQGLVDNCSKLNIREFPNIDSKVLTILNKGDKVQITSDNDGWYGVVYKGLSGFCMKEYINKKEV